VIKRTANYVTLCLSYTGLWFGVIFIVTQCTLCPTQCTSDTVYTVSGKKHQNIFVISSIKLGWFWWNLVCSFPNNFLQNHLNIIFPPHLTLPCQT